MHETPEERAMRCLSFIRRGGRITRMYIGLLPSTLSDAGLTLADIGTDEDELGMCREQGRKAAAQELLYRIATGQLPDHEFLPLISITSEDFTSLEEVVLFLSSQTSSVKELPAGYVFSNSDLRKIVRQGFMLMCKHELESIRSRNTMGTYDAARSIREKMRIAGITIEEIGSKEDELRNAEAWVRNHWRNLATDYLLRLRGERATSYSADFLGYFIRAAKRLGGVTLSDIGTNEEELRALEQAECVRAARRKMAPMN